MSQEDNKNVKYESLLDRNVVHLFVDEDKFDEPYSPLKYMSGSDIKSFGRRFGVETQNENRKNAMTEVFQYGIRNNNIMAMISYLLGPIQQKEVIKKRINDKRTLMLVFGTSRVNQDVNREELIVNELGLIRDEALEKINGELAYTQQKLVMYGDDVFLERSDALPHIRVKPERFDIERVKELLSHAKRDLHEGDYESVITKARTILEESFIQILSGRGVEYDARGNIIKLKNKVQEVLGMKARDSWNPRIEQLVGSLSGVVKGIAELRNNDSDAHASKKRVKVKKEEAELIINAASDLAIYYLGVNERQKNL